MTLPKPQVKPAFAKSTSVEVDKTKLDIQKMLERYGATSFLIGFNQEVEVITFEIGGRRIRFSFPVLTLSSLPSKNKAGRAFGASNMPGGTQEGMLEQAKRTRWRELNLLIKAKLVAIEAGITTIEEEFLSHVVLPNHQTVHEWMTPQLKRIYEGGQMPLLLPGSVAKKDEE